MYRLAILFLLVLTACDKGDYDRLQHGTDGDALRPGQAQAEGALQHLGVYNTDAYRRFVVHGPGRDFTILLDTRSGRSWHQQPAATAPGFQWAPVQVALADTNRLNYSPLFGLGPADPDWDGVQDYDNVAQRFDLIGDGPTDLLLLDRKWGRTWSWSQQGGKAWWIPVVVTPLESGATYSPLRAFE